MSLWRQLTHGFRVLTKRTAADQDIDDEVQHYLDEAAAALESRGFSPEDARRAARVDIGNMIVVREQVRASGWESAVTTLAADLRYGLRRLRGNPGFAAVSVFTLALGIGASTAIFSTVNPILFEPLPYPGANRVMMIWENTQDGRRGNPTFGAYHELAARSRSFDALAVMKPWQPAMTSASQPERFNGQQVSAGYLRALGVAPALGRDFEASDDRLHGPRVVIIADTLWRRRFNGDGAIVGREVILDGDSYTVIGVMPRAFENVLAPGAEVWAPLQYDMSEGRAWGHHLRMVGRPAAGIGKDQARRTLDAIAHSPAPEFPRAPWASVRDGFILNSLQDEVTESVRPALLVVLGAVLLVLTIACVNVTNLLLARGAQRQGEFAMRGALGAARSRMIRQLLTESLLLAALGGAVGMGVAELGVAALVALSPPGLPRVAAIHVDGTVFAFGMALTTLIGLLVGLIPALQASHGGLYGGMQRASRRTSGSHRMIRSTLVVTEVALALVLLVSAGLLLRSMQRLFAVAPGFNASHLLTMQVQTSGHRFDSPNATHHFFADALEAVRRVPGVASAAFTSQLPLSGDFDVYGVQFDPLPNGEPSSVDAFRYAVTPGYFETIGIPLLRGRLLDAHDVAGAPGAALINQSLAERRFRGEDPVGRRIRVGTVWCTIAGVVGDVKQTSLAVSQADAVYVASVQWSTFADPAMSLVVRTHGDAAALAPAIREAIWAVDKDQPIVRVATMEGLVTASAAERRFALILFEVFAAVALVLAAVGIYGVLSGGVTERMREIGVRAALGASRSDILALIVRQGMTLTGIGVAVGLGGAAAASYALVKLLFGVSHLDSTTYLGVTALLVAVAAIASWAPAWRAARVDPSVTLRAE